MKRSGRLTTASVVLAAMLLTSACGSGVTTATPDAQPSPAGTPDRGAMVPDDATEADLVAYLPPETLFEETVGSQLDFETSPDRTQLWEGMNEKKLHLVGSQVGFYRNQQEMTGGYVALSLFESTGDAKTFLSTNPSFNPNQKPNVNGYGNLVEFGALVDEGHGYAFTEDSDGSGPGDTHGSAIVRMDRMVVEVAMFGGAEAEYPADLRAIVGAVSRSLSDAAG